jgi:hypothetical protein
MKGKAIEVKILEMTKEKLKVKLPFTNVPVQMNIPFFKTRLKAGYFKLNSPDQLFRLFRTS